MARESTSAQPTSQAVATFVLYVALMLFLAVFSRPAIASTLGIFRQLVRTLLFVTSWPIYLGLLPVRALVFLSGLSVKLMFFGAIAAVAYFALGGSPNVGVVRDIAWAALQFL